MLVVNPYVRKYVKPYTNPLTTEAGDILLAEDGSILNYDVFTIAGTIRSLMHFNGTNGSDVFVDEVTNGGSGNKVITKSNGGVYISTADSKFGGASLYSDFYENYISVANCGPLPNNGDMSYGIWYKRTSGGQGWLTTLMSFGDVPANNYVSFQIDSYYQTAIFRINGTNYLDWFSLSNLGDWNYFVVERVNGTWYLSQNGQVFFSTASEGTVGYTNITNRIGGLMGFADEAILVTGTSIWGGQNFVPPSDPFVLNT